MKIRLLACLIGMIALFSSCYTHFVRQSGSFTPMNAQQIGEDSTLRAAIQPYKKQLESEMATVICQSAAELTKQQPESTMGNWAADAVAKKAADYSGLAIDFGVLNYGGLRVGSLPKGNITKGHIFELMPFDNLVVIIEMKGSELPVLFDHIAAKGGWPVSSGVQFKINADKKAEAIVIQGKAIQPDKIYTIATNDYVANGGDNCSFFVQQKHHDTGKFLRDAIIEYCQALQQQGKAIEATVEGRIAQ